MMRNRTDFLSLLSEQQQNQIKKNLKTFEKAKKEYLKSEDESLQKFRYRYLSVEEQKEYDKISSKYENDIHDAFVELCLAPEGYKTGSDEVYVTVVGIEKNSDSNYVSVSLVTPSMAYIDNRYFVSGNDDEDHIWWKAYRPYYYELVAHLTDEELDHFNNQISHLKTTCEFDDNKGWSFWFKAKLKEKQFQESNDYMGILHFGGSESFANELVITSFEPVSAEFSKMLNRTYTITIKPNKQACINYLNAFFANAYSYKVKILNVGQANCIYIEDINSYLHFFFDLGRPNSGFYDWNSKKYLKNTDLQQNSDVQNNLDSISSYNPDCIIISHWHLDHFAAFKDLNDYGVNSVWILPKIISKKDIKSASRLLNYLAVNHATIYYLNTSGKIFDNGVVQLLSSISARNDDPNSRSLMLRIKDTVFSADCLYEFWPDDLITHLNDVKRLVVPHHCSKLSSNQSGKKQEASIFTDFGKSPMKEAYISMGFNTYHHPYPDHLIELRKASFDLYYTKNAINYYEFDII